VADEAFSRVGGREGAAQTRGQREREDGERFVESFAHALRGAGILGLQAAREIEQQPVGGLHISGLIGPPQDRLRPRPLAIAQVLEDQMRPTVD
jgi:hypothetical protein